MSIGVYAICYMLYAICYVCITNIYMFLLFAFEYIRNSYLVWKSVWIEGGHIIVVQATPFKGVWVSCEGVVMATVSHTSVLMVDLYVYMFRRGRYQ